MRVLFLAPKCFPPTGSEALTNAKLATALLRAGVEVDVVCAVPTISSKTYPESQSGLWMPLERAVCQAALPLLSNVRALVSYVRILARTRHIYGRAHWILPALQAVRRLLERNRYDCLVSRSGPAEMVALVAGRENGIPWIANWNDPFPGDKAPAPYGKGPRFRLPWYWRRVLRAIVKTAACHTYPCERLRRYMTGYLPGATLERSCVIPHIALDELVCKPAEAGHPKLRLAHTGDVRPPRDPQVFLEGFSDFVEECGPSPAIQVTFMGRHPEAFADRVAAMRLDCYVSVLEEKSYEDSIELLRSSDMAMLIEAPCEVGIFLPNKVVEYAQCGKPILAISPKVGTVNDMISEWGGGIVADCTSRHAVKDSLMRVYSSWKRGRLLEEFSPAQLLDQFSEQRVVSAFREAVKTVLARQAS